MNQEHIPEREQPTDLAKDLIELINATVTPEGAVRVAALYNEYGPAAIAFARLPDTNLEDPQLRHTFGESYMASHVSKEDAIQAELRDQGWLAATAEHRTRHGIPPDVLVWDQQAVWGAMNEMYDLVEYAGHIHVFWK